MDIYLVGKTRILLISETDMIDVLRRWLVQNGTNGKIWIKSGEQESIEAFIARAKSIYKSIAYDQECCDCLVYTDHHKLWLAREECSDIIDGKHVVSAY